MASVIDILEYLKDHHTAEGGAIKGKDLCILFNLTDKHLRNIISDLRQAGKPICSSSYGYWYSDNPEDIEKTLRRLERQVSNMNKSIKGLKGILQEVEENV
jgi:hypothetical protein